VAFGKTSLFINCLLTTVVEMVSISCWYGVWVLEDRLSDTVRLDHKWQTALASLVSECGAKERKVCGGG
jgi:hypothetical protein